MPSNKVVFVASCHLTSPSDTEYFSATPRITAHRTLTPSILPTIEPVARSPPPSPVAASNKPGPMIENFFAILIEYLETTLDQYSLLRLQALIPFHLLLPALLKVLKSLWPHDQHR